MDGFRTAASEFPNDNPELHDGAVWVCLSVCGPLRAIRRPLPEPAAPPAPAPEPLPVEASGPDPFEELVQVMVRVALESGATRAAAVLPALLAGESVEVVAPEGTLETAAIWRHALRGEDVDLSACESTLDSWCAELIAAISGTPARSGELRRELRAKGVAAFGLLRAA